MPQSTHTATIVAFAAVLAAVIPLPAPAQDVTFSANSRVEGRLGSHWDHCTVIGERRTTGGYVLRCDSLPNQDMVFAASDVRALQGPDRPAKPVVHAVMQAKAPAAEAAAFKAIQPRVGVYGCMNQDAFELAGLQFGLLDASTYSTFDGGRGRYTYSPRTGILTFTSGPFAGLRRSRYTERSFLILDEHGAKTAFVCPWSAKDPRKKHW